MASLAVEDGGEGEVRRTASRRARLLGFVIVSVAAIIVLTFVGASPILILEVFSLAIMLAVFAVVIVIIFGGRRRIRW